jgi:hypothetical protein
MLDIAMKVFPQFHRHLEIRRVRSKLERDSFPRLQMFPPLRYRFEECMTSVEADGGFFFRWSIWSLCSLTASPVRMNMAQIQKQPSH